MRARFIVGCLAVCVGFGSEPRAHADQSEEQAALLFGEGREEMKKRDYAAACNLFEESERLDPSAGTALNLAVCAERLGQFVRARGKVELFFSIAPPDDDRMARVQQLAADLDKRIAHLSVQLEPARRSGAQVTIDDHVIDAPDRPFAIDPGAHRISVTAPGYIDQHVNVELAPGELAERRVALVPVVPPRSRPVALPSASPARQPAKLTVSPFFYPAFALGVAGALAVIESSAMIDLERSRVAAHCVDKRCDSTGLAAGRRGKTFASINIVAWPVAVLGSSLSAYLFFKRRSSALNARYALGFSFQPQQAGLTFEASFP